MAAPSGCSLLFSAVPTMASSRERGILFPSTTILTWITLGAPYVIVPVLSNTTDWTWPPVKQGNKVIDLESFSNTKNCTVQLAAGIQRTCTLWAISSGSPPLIRMPFWAPTPVPTMTAVGVAKPREQGQAMHKTVMEAWKAKRMTASALEMLLS